MTYTTSFPIQFDPIPHPAAVAIIGNARFTVLTERLLRLEYSPHGRFEDRPSQAFWYRRQPVPNYETWQENGRFHLTTPHLHLNYRPDTPLSADSLTITLRQNGATWHYGQKDPTNLRGTTRTLDEANGALALEEGLLSRSGWAVYDDTHRLVFNQDGWLEPRHAPSGSRDLYFFGYGTDAAACLHDFAQIAGPAPLLPRWALGNWWSRYWAYSATELLNLVDEFRTHHVPLAVCIVDMDWHITNTGNASRGWTGYTWNRDLFPDPPAFLAELHRRGLKTALNLHPADGVWPHEAQYTPMAHRLGIDPATQEPIPFNIADPAFTKAYFELLHHPQEADGVDFWWMDWQQGTLSALPGLDPLWWLNHLHFYDLGRDGQKRPFTFSRWGGLGNHRYPIGFSGDTVITWDSLAFQPTFTATAANVNYGWWSHDIGGHMGGFEEPELYARWVQFGLFSPILRLHSTNNPFHERRPWGHDAETARIASAALRLRHAFIPYLYSMAWRNHTHHLPLVQPMYHTHPTAEPAYHCPDQYTFGSELIAAPFITPADADTRLSRQVVWLPAGPEESAGQWFGFFDGLPFAGDGWHAIYGRLTDIPVFAKAGAIVPLAAEGENGVENPAALDVHLFPGAENRFALYEDDGLHTHSLTPIIQQFSAAKWQVTVGPASGEISHLPAHRTWKLLFRGAAAETAVAANHPTTTQYNAQTHTLTVMTQPLAPDATLTVILTSGHSDLLAPRQPRLERCQRLVTAFRMESWTKQRLYHQLPDLVAHPQLLGEYELSLTDSQRQALAETITGAGVHQRPQRHNSGTAVILWNNEGWSGATYRLAGQTRGWRRPPQVLQGQLPTFARLTAEEECLTWENGAQTIVLAPRPWRLQVNLLAGVTAVLHER